MKRHPGDHYWAKEPREQNDFSRSVVSDERKVDEQWVDAAQNKAMMLPVGEVPLCDVKVGPRSRFEASCEVCAAGVPSANPGSLSEVDVS
jgi:hypothetical protein